MDDVLTPLIRDFLTQNQDTQLAAEELRQAINGIIGRHGLQPPAVISQSTQGQTPCAMFLGFMGDG